MAYNTKSMGKKRGENGAHHTHMVTWRERNEKGKGETLGIKHKKYGGKEGGEWSTPHTHGDMEGEK